MALLAVLRASPKDCKIDSLECCEAEFTLTCIIAQFFSNLHGQTPSYYVSSIVESQLRSFGPERNLASIDNDISMITRFVVWSQGADDLCRRMEAVPSAQKKIERRNQVKLTNTLLIRIFITDIVSLPDGALS